VYKHTHRHTQTHAPMIIHTQNTFIFHRGGEKNRFFDFSRFSLERFCLDSEKFIIDFLIKKKKKKLILNFFFFFFFLCLSRSIFFDLKKFKKYFFNKKKKKKINLNFFFFFFFYTFILC